MIRAVFLDLDDTLVDFGRAARAGLRAALGAEANYELWRTLTHYRRFDTGELGFQEMRELRMADYLALVGRGGDDAAALEQLRFDSLDAHFTLFDDALPCLASLRERGLLLGLITNNEALHQRRKISSVGLDGLFDAVVISGEVGVAKPDEAIFAHACRAVGVEPSQALHVGDNLRADALGAYGAGLRGVWLDRDGRHDGRELQVPVITALAELTELLA